MSDWLFFLDDIQRVCNTYCVQWWQAVGVLLAAIATLSVVWVSLCLARREHRFAIDALEREMRPWLSVEMQPVGQPVPAPNNAMYWAIRVEGQMRNHGRTPATNVVMAARLITYVDEISTEKILSYCDDARRAAEQFPKHDNIVWLKESLNTFSDVFSDTPVHITPQIPASRTAEFLTWYAENKQVKMVLVGYILYSPDKSAKRFRLPLAYDLMMYRDSYIPPDGFRHPTEREPSLFQLKEALPDGCQLYLIPIGGLPSGLTEE